MNSFNGDLYFTAGIDDSKFNVSAEAMERRVQEMSASVQSEAADMETSIQQFAQKGAEYITTFLVGKGMLDLTKSIIQVRGEFQQLEIAFETMLGSTEKANDLMAQLTRTAARTPFDLQGVAQGAKQLLAYGTAAEEVNDVLVHLGDIASGLSIPLNDLVMLYGTTMTQGRMFTQDLRQFMGRGIPIAEELAKQFGVTKDKVGELVTQGKVTSREFNAAIMAMSSEGGKFYNLMERQSTALTGQISNLEDAWDVARNNIGKDMEGIAGDAISMATSVVENLEPILNIVRAVAIAYGSYRAALILNSLATKGETGVALIDNTVKKAKIQLLRLEEKATSGAAERIRELKKARQEEIATLESQLSAEGRLNLIHQTRIANIGKVLTETQKLELRNLGLVDSMGNLTGSTEDYERIALSMMSNEQRMAVERGELTKNTGDYIVKLHEAVDAKHVNIQAIDDEIAKTQEELKFAVDYRNVVQEQVATSRDRVKSLENEISVLDLAGDSEGAAAKATEWKAEKTKLATLEEELNTAATSVNEKQTNLETLAKKRNTAATVGNATADKAATASKNLLTVATKKATLAIKTLWAAMKANPLGWILTAVGLVVSAISMFSNKSKEAEIEEGTLANATKKAGEEFDKEKGKIDALTKIIHDNNVSLDERKKKLNELKAIIPDYHADLTTEGQLINDNTDAIKNYCAELERQIKLKAAQEELEEAYRKQRKAEKELETAKAGRESYIELHTITEENKWMHMFDAGSGMAGGYNNPGAELAAIEINISSAQGKLDKVNKEIEDLTNEIATRSKESVETAEETVTVAQRRAQLVQQIAKLEKEIKAATAPGATYDEKAIKSKQDELKTLKHELQNLNGGRTQKQIDQQLENEKNAAQKLADMQTESERARIAAMEDGFDKRMAQMEFERQQELAKIEEDAKALKKARKKAGMSEELTQEEQNNLQSRRNSVNAKYGNSRAEMANEEINTMREKYREYEQWVEMIGQEAADKHFRGLRDAGESFSAWVQNQITLLESKKRQNPSEFTSGDERALSSFTEASTTTDLDYYDKLKRSIEGSVEMAGTLTAKIQALRAAIEQIKNDPNLTNDQKGALGLEYAQQIINAEDENQRRFNETYKTYSQTRREMVEQYQRDIDQLIHNGDTFQAEQVKAQMKRAMGDLDTNFLKSLFGEVFSGKATTKAIRAAVKDLGNIKNMSLDEFNEKYHQNFNPEDFDQLKDKIDAVSSSLKEMGSYNIADAFKDIRDGRLEGDLERVARGTQFIQTAFQNFTSVVSALSSALNDLAEASDNENLKNTAKTVNQVSNVLGSAGQWAGMGASIGGGWGALIGGVIGGGLGIFTEIFKSKEEEKAEEKERHERAMEYMNEIVSGIATLSGSVNSLQDTLSSLDYENYRKAILDVINDMKDLEFDSNKNWKGLRDGISASGAIPMLDEAHIRVVYEAFMSRLERNTGNYWYGEGVEDLIDRIANKYDTSTAEGMRQLLEDYYSGAFQSWLGESYTDNFIDWLMGKLSWGDIVDDSARREYANQENHQDYLFYQKQKDLLEELNDLYMSGSLNTLDYFNALLKVDQLELEALRRKKEELEKAGASREDILNIDRQIAEKEYDIAERFTRMFEGLAGVDLSSIVMEWADIFDQFGDDVDGAFDAIDKSVDRMIANIIRNQFLIRPMMEQFDRIMKQYSTEDGLLNEDSFTEAAESLRALKYLFRDQWEIVQRMMEEAGIDMSELTGADPSTLTGSIQNVSEETAGIIAGRMNAVVINQAEGVSVMRQQLLVQYEMRNSLVAIQSDVNSIKRRLDNTATPNPYLHMGII